MFKQINYTSGKGRYRLYCRAFNTGAGLIVHLLGGTEPHVGAVALALPRASLQGRGRSASTSVLTLLNHKDDELARPAAAELAAGFNCPVVVIAGVHIEAAKPGEIALLVARARRAVSSILKVGRNREHQN